MVLPLLPGFSTCPNSLAPPLEPVYGSLYHSRRPFAPLCFLFYSMREVLTIFEGPHVGPRTTPPAVSFFVLCFLDSLSPLRSPRFRPPPLTSSQLFFQSPNFPDPGVAFRSWLTNNPRLKIVFFLPPPLPLLAYFPFPPFHLCPLFLLCLFVEPFLRKLNRYTSNTLPDWIICSSPSFHKSVLMRTPLL